MFKEQRPLVALRRYAYAQGGIVKDSEEIEQFLEQLEPSGDHDREWRKSACYPPPYVARLNNVTVMPGSRMLLSTDGRALCDELESSWQRMGLPPKVPDMEISSGPILHFNLPLLGKPIESAVHLMGEHDSNYFHWIVEVLPRAFILEQLTLATKVPLLVSAGLPASAYALLHLVVGSRVILRIEAGNRHNVEQLIYPSDLSCILDVYDRPPSEDTTYLPVGLLRRMSASIKAAVGLPASVTPRRIFVRRASGYRRLLNELEVENEFVRNGFTPVEPGTLTAAEQIHTFTGAEVIVGPSGAAMANILWASRGSRVCILHSDHPFKKYPYLDALGRAAGAILSYVSGPRAHAVSGLFEAHDDFRIEPSAVQAILNSL